VQDVSSNKAVPKLTSGRLLAQNTIWNLLGQLLPMGAVVLAIPALVKGLGVDRFGLLSLAWIVIGYLSLFDLGIGRALTQLVADRLARNEEHSIPPLAWTSLSLMLLLGVIGGVIGAAFTPWMVHQVFKIPALLQPEALHSFYLLSASVPMVTITAGFRGILEAQQRFRILNLIRIPMSIFFFVGPLLAFPFSRSLTTAIAVLVAIRFVGILAHAIACFHVMPLLRQNFVLRRSLIVPVVRFGGWMTVSNVISPIMVYMDRFLIGALLSLPQLAYYTAPFDVVTRLTIIPGALSGVLFPAFTVSLLQNRERTGMLLERGVKYTYLTIFPLVFFLAMFAPEGLRFWLGPGFAQTGSSVLRWLAAGVFVNSLAYMASTLLYSAGRPDLNAKLHLIELPVYLVMLILLVKGQGIVGAAIAWVARISLDAVLLTFCAHRILPHRPRFLLRLGGAVFAGLLLLYAGTLPQAVGLKVVIGLSCLVLYGFATWFWCLAPEERRFLSRKHNRGFSQRTEPSRGELAESE